MPSSKPAHRRRRSLNQIQGDTGEPLVAAAFPKHWVVRKVQNDYGLDLHVEVFDWVEDGVGQVAETLGEHFFVQVKSAARVSAVSGSSSVINSSKARPIAGAPLESVPVISYPLDVGELMTVEAMGSAIPVVLCVADMATGNVYFVCLNDYITKVLLPFNPDYTQQKTVNVQIPARNLLDRSEASLTYLHFLARRAKLYGAFNTFNYQHEEMKYIYDRLVPFSEMVGDASTKVPDDIIQTIDVFVEADLRLDIWRGPTHWYPLDELHERLLGLRGTLEVLRQPHSGARMWSTALSLLQVFESAALLGRVYEEVIRQARLPTGLAAQMDGG